MDYVWVNKMEKIEKTIRYTSLYNAYHSLLSDSQKNVINDYYFADLSLSEIAQNRGISRAAVEDALLKGCNKLDELEEKLHVVEKSGNLREKILVLREKSLNQSEVDEIDELLKELEYGI